jgi:hypothetical protein
MNFSVKLPNGATYTVYPPVDYREMEAEPLERIAPDAPENDPCSTT